MKKRVLVTGAEGFIGSHLVEKLLIEGHYVRAFVLYNSFSDIGWLKGLNNSELEIYFGDIRDKSSLRSALEGIDVVYHLAALISIPYSYENPEGYVTTNTIGTLNLLEEARYVKLNHIFITSTSEVYGSAIKIPIDESHPLQAQSPYSASKIAADKLAESYFKTFNLPITIIRPFNTYGPRQSTRAIIPRIISQLKSNPSTVRLGSLYPVRDFNYVKDTVSGMYSLMINSNSIGLEVNIASGVGISIEELINKIAKLMNIDYKVELDKERIRPANSEVDRLIGDASLIKSISGWETSISLNEGLMETIEYYLKTDTIETADYIK